MTVKKLLIIALLVFYSVLLFGEDSKAIEARLNATLQNTVVVLRAPRVGNKVALGLDGKSSSPVGIRGFHDKVHIDSVRISNNRLVIRGPRLQDAYSIPQNAITMMRLPYPIEIHLALADPTSEVSIRQAIQAAFLREDELAAQKCSQFTYLADLFREEYKHASKPPYDPIVPDRAASEACVPSGKQGWLLGKGVKPPKAIETPAPELPRFERQTEKMGGVELAIRVDESGKITDGVVLRTSTAGYDQTTTDMLSRWSFKPAEKDGYSTATIFPVLFDYILGNWCESQNLPRVTNRGFRFQICE